MSPLRTELGGIGDTSASTSNCHGSNFVNVSDADKINSSNNMITLNESNAINSELDGTQVTKVTKATQNQQQQQQHQQADAQTQLLYVNSRMYATADVSTIKLQFSQNYPAGELYQSSATAHLDLMQSDQTNEQQQQQQQQQHCNYTSYLANSYEQLYQQQQQSHISKQLPQVEQKQGVNAYQNSPSSQVYTNNDYNKENTGHFHSYQEASNTDVQKSISSNNNFNSNNLDSVQSATVTSVSPLISNSSNSSGNYGQMSVSDNVNTVGSSGNPNSPSAALAFQCKSSEHHDHSINTHIASPYASSGYASSPYIKEDQRQQLSPSNADPVTPTKILSSGESGEILDLDSQELLGSSKPISETSGKHLQVIQNASWHQQATESFPSVLQSQASQSSQPSYYRSSQQSPYAGTKVESEYSLISNADSGSIASSPQIMSSFLPAMPADLPPTTTEQNLQEGLSMTISREFQSTSSDLALPSNNMEEKASNWKSNEARRPKNYYCPSCDKSFTSSGHLKRHYNTNLHKNAIKSSGQLDPATLSVPTNYQTPCEPSAKVSRRNAATSIQRKKTVPAPVEPPEPPNGDVSGNQITKQEPVAVSVYGTASSPTSMQQHQSDNCMTQTYQQFVPPIRSTTTYSITSISDSPPNNHFRHHHQQQQQQQQIVINGHPNALAGLSVPTMSTPPSQMRGLLNTTTNTLIKSEPMQTEAAMEDQKPESQDPHFQKVLQHGSPPIQDNPEQLPIQLKTQQIKQEEQMTMVLDLNAAPHHQHQILTPLEYQQHTHLPLIRDNQSRTALQEMITEQYYHNTMPNSTNMPIHTQLIISHQQYQEPQEQHMADHIYTHTPITSPQQRNIMETQSYSIMPLVTSMQPNNMLQLQPVTTIPTANNTRSILSSQHNIHLLPMEAQHMETLTNHTNTPLLPPILPSHIKPSSNNSTIPSFQHLQQAASGQLPLLDHTVTYPHTVIGTSSQLPSNSEILTLDSMAYSNFLASQQQGQLLQVISSKGATTLYTQSSNNTYMAHGSPQEGDLPPNDEYYAAEQNNTSADLPPLPSSSSKTITPLVMEESKTNMKFDVKREKVTSDLELAKASQQSSKIEIETPCRVNKRKRNLKSVSDEQNISFNYIVLPNGRIKCLDCNKDFAKICYLTQHSKSFHHGVYPYRCVKCGKRYQSEERYKAHLPRHDLGEKPHKCQLCPKQFHHKTDLRRHVEAIHGKKQYKCDMCGKRFCRQDHLRKHINTHTKSRMTPRKSSKISRDKHKDEIKTKMSNTQAKQQSSLTMQIQSENTFLNQSLEQNNVIGVDDNNDEQFAINNEYGNGNGKEEYIPIEQYVKLQQQEDQDAIATTSRDAREQERQHQQIQLTQDLNEYSTNVIKTEYQIVEQKFSYTNEENDKDE
uniref:C2H2-type domain-containing protein n=1 Tax=Glossina brevipalpis TaxID=37001 RepID=A0A1A9W6D1_9MUSC